MQAKLILFSGLPGTGKSTLAGRLARELKLPLLSIDRVIGAVPENADVAFWDSKVAILLDLMRAQLELDLSVIVDSVFMNKDRYHAQEIARRHNARFLPVYLYISDEKVWKERVTKRYNEMNDPAVAHWERIQHQRQHFREWDPETALFIDSLYPFVRNFETVLNFVLNEEVSLKSLEEMRLTEGKYHE
jgi:predicted kinase